MEEMRREQRGCFRTEQLDQGGLSPVCGLFCLFLPGRPLFPYIKEGCQLAIVTPAHCLLRRERHLHIRQNGKINKQINKQTNSWYRHTLASIPVLSIAKHLYLFAKLNFCH